MATSSLQLQERDTALLRGLFESRVLTAVHAATLFFDGRVPAAGKRLQKLKAAGFIAERPRHPFQPAVLFLTRKGLVLLQEQGILAQYPPFSLPTLERRARVSDQTVRHELEVMDVKTAFHSAIRANPSFSIAEFSTWPMLNEFTACRHAGNGQEFPVRPDGFIRIHENADFVRTFFLEVDRSNEVQDAIVGKAECYYDYYKSGGFAVRNGAPRSDYRKFPFRVLMVFKTEARRNNTAERLLQSSLPVLNQFCLSTFEDVSRDPFGKICFSLSEYRDAVKGSPFDVADMTPRWTNKPESARDKFVEEHVEKFSILAG